MNEYFPVIVDPERIAQLMAHRACIGVEHDPANGKLHGYCVVCGVPWPCDYAGKPPAATQEQPAGSGALREALGELLGKFERHATYRLISQDETELTGNFRWLPTEKLFIEDVRYQEMLALLSLSSPIEPQCEEARDKAAQIREAEQKVIAKMRLYLRAAVDDEISYATEQEFQEQLLIAVGELDALLSPSRQGAGGK